MTNRRKLLWTGAALVLLAGLAAVSVPSLFRPGANANRVFVEGRSAAEAMPAPPPPPPGSQPARLALYAQVSAPERKLIQNAELALLVADVRAAAERIRIITQSNHGEIDKLEITEDSGGALSASLMVRVPAAGLESALAEFKKVAVRIEREQVSARDVTREFYDNEAHMRNLRAEENQYLLIMKQAHTVKDTLDVAEKLSDVRDRIERLQADIQVMTHDIEMSVVSITLGQESDAQVLGIHWRPLYNARVAARELLAGLGEWLDWVVALLIKLPLIILWVMTVGGILWLAWKIGRPAWQRVVKPRAASK